MARTAHTARKEVPIPSKSIKTTKANSSGNDSQSKEQQKSQKTVKKLNEVIEKLDKAIEKTEKVDKKVSKVMNNPKAKKTMSIKTPVINQGEKPAKSLSKKSKNILKEIKYYQTNIGFLIPKANIIRIIRSLILDLSRGSSSNEFRFTSTSLNVIHEAIENHLVSLLELSFMAARHAKRVTLFASDIRLIHKIKRNIQ